MTSKTYSKFSDVPLWAQIVWSVAVSGNVLLIVSGMAGTARPWLNSPFAEISLLNLFLWPWLFVAALVIWSVCFRYPEKRSIAVGLLSVAAAFVATVANWIRLMRAFD
jgi:hypothetical protein